MAEDYSISAKITADTSGFEKGIDKAQKASKNLSKSVSGVIQGLGKNGLVGALGAVGLASSGLTATLGSVVKIAKQVSKTIGECTEAYKTQLIAERALNTAIQNNPFVTGVSSKALKEFASEMQKVSNYGDEELIPMMSNLVSLGRTESETMKIMSVALDMSANGSMSLDTAINQLNATLNGNIGRLGQQNAELKDLTEEELRQGKAVEILGEKFKGLSSATADTSKQLKNIKGDFKEALGQFTLPSSDMWNKFWAGFYERGIEVINKINSYLDAQTIGKKLAGAITDQLKAFGTGDIGGRIDYIRNTLNVVTDEELLAIQNYLEGLSYISTDQEQILRRIKAELDARKQAVIDQKAQTEASAKQKKEEEERLAKAKELEEQEKKNAEERAKALKLQSEWEDKLFAIRLERLEETREKELENEELTQEEREAIVDFYGEQILAMKIKQLEKEREEALAQENLTEEAKRAINLYYENRITNVRKDEEEKRLKLKKKTSEEEVKDEKKKFAEMLKVAGEYTKKLAETFKNVAKKIASTVKSIVSGIGNIFSKLFDFNPDDALTNLLIFEDKVLTFFVETLPKLPKFFESAVSSIIHTIQQVLAVIDFDVIADIISSIIKSIGGLITSITQYINENADKIIDGFTKLVKTVIDGLTNWVQSGGWKSLLDALLVIQKAIENAVAENLPAIVDTIVEMLPDLVQFLIDSIVSASQTLAKLIRPIIKLIMALIEALVDVLLSDEVIGASLDAMMDLFDAIIDDLVPAIIRLIPKIILKIISAVIKNFPKIVKMLVDGFIKAFTQTNWVVVVKELFIGFIDAFKDLFGIHSPSTLFEGFGVNVIEGLWNGIQSACQWLKTKIETVFNNIADGIKNAFTGIRNFFAGIFEGIGNVIKAPINAVIDMVNHIIGGLNQISFEIPSWVPFVGGNRYGIDLPYLDRLATGTDNARKGLAIVGEAGPELIRFNGGEQVLNTRNTQKALAGAGGKSNTFNVTFNNTKDTTAFTMIQQLKQYNRQMAINGIM